MQNGAGFPRRRSKMVGDLGIEPSMSRLGGVTVRCRTLQHIAHYGAVISEALAGRQGQKGAIFVEIFTQALGCGFCFHLALGPHSPHCRARIKRG